jgi:hypothetical protein
MSAQLDHFLVAAALLSAAGYLVYRLRPKPGGKACGGGCCPTAGSKKAASPLAKPASPSASPKTRRP